MHEILGLACFPMDENGQKFFGFSEYLAALALMVVAWTIADVRYKFRISTAAFPILNLSYYLLSFVGIATLITDVSRAGKKCAIYGDFFTPSEWQGLLGAIFLFVFLAWAWFSFVSPSKFGRWNGTLYLRELQRTILKSNADECRVIGEEVGRSADSIVRYAWTPQEYSEIYGAGNRKRFFIFNIWYRSRFHANDILGLISDTRFCKYLVQTSSVSIFEIFEAVVKQRKLNISIDVFAKNITIEAVNYKDSFVYNEVGRYSNGYLGNAKIFTSMLYGNYELIESMKIVYQTYSDISRKWDSEQWAAYFRLVVLTMYDYVEASATRPRSRVLAEVMMNLHMIASPKIDISPVGVDWYLDEDYKKFKVVCEFLSKSIEVLNSGHPFDLKWLKVPKNSINVDIFDDIAVAIYNVVVSASLLKNNRGYCLAVQYGVVWNNFFRYESRTKEDDIIRFKVRRQIYDEIVLLEEFPNFQGACLLAMLMNIYGFSNNQGLRSTKMRLFYKVILNWVKRNYVNLMLRNKAVAEACLIEGIEYDPIGYRLIKTLPAFGGRPPTIQTLLLDSPTP
jgi:hypothetical protein